MNFMYVSGLLRGARAHSCRTARGPRKAGQEVRPASLRTLLRTPLSCTAGYLTLPGLQNVFEGPESVSLLLAESTLTLEVCACVWAGLPLLQQCLIFV